MKKIQYSVCVAGSANNLGSESGFASVMIIESVVAPLYLDMTGALTSKAADITEIIQ